MNTISTADWFSLFLIPAGLYLIRLIANWWRNTRPVHKLLESICDNKEPCKIFVRDLILDENSKLLAFEPRLGYCIVPNIKRLYTEVEGKGIAYIFNVLGQAGKIQNIEVIGMGEDVRGEWNSNVILLGAQSQKHLDFYSYMKKVAYRMDAIQIYNAQNNDIIQREDGFGYGIILKAENPHKSGKEKGVAFLIGGYGVLGTVAAAYYFKQHFKQLGKEFGRDCFGVVIRAPVTAGEQAVERISNLDIRFGSKRKLSWTWKKKQKATAELSQYALKNPENSQRVELDSQPVEPVNVSSIDGSEEEIVKAIPLDQLGHPDDSARGIPQLHPIDPGMTAGSGLGSEAKEP
jgi:hypothetical protein